MKLSLFFFGLFFIQLNFAQIQKDTTFTNHSEFQKVVKKYPFVNLVQFVPTAVIQEKTNIVYHRVNERSLHLDAYLPMGKNLKTAVVLIHGGGWKSGDKEMMKPLAQKLATNGFPCFAVEFRLSGEAKYPAAIEDVIASIRYLNENSSKFRIDPKKIVLLGTSSGGQMAALIGTKYPDLINAVIDIDGILAFHHPQSKEGEAATKWLGGKYEEIPEVWKEASPLTHVNKNSKSFLFINSAFERFHAGRDDMIEKLNQFGIFSKVEIFEKALHTFWMFDPWFNPTVEFIIQFLKNQNQQ